MIVNIKKFLILDDNQDVNSEFYMYSQIIKNERVRRNLTLAESSKGICSISYLSKVENQVIEPEANCLKALFAKYDLDFELVSTLYNQTHIDDVIKFYVHQNYAKIDELHSIINKEIFSTSNAIVKGFYNLIHNLDAAFLQEIGLLDRIKKTLRKKEKLLLLILVNEFLIKQHKHKEAFPYLRLLRTISILDKEMKWLVAEQEFICGYHTGNFMMMQKNYMNIIQNHYLGFPTQRQLLVRMMMLDYQSEEYYDACFEEVNSLNLDQLSEKFSTDMNYYKYMIMIRGCKFFDIFDEVINRNLYCDSKFIALLAYCAFRTKDKKHVHHVKQLLANHQYEKKDEVHKRFIDFMIMKINDPKDLSADNIDYLKVEILHFIKDHYHVLYNRVYEFLFYEAMGKMSKYKDVYTYFGKNILI